MHCTACAKPLPEPVGTKCPFCAEPIHDDDIAEAIRSELETDRTFLRIATPMDRSGWAIAAGYAALFCLIILPGPLALALGLVALWDLKRRPHKIGRGRAWFGIIAGGLATAVLLLIAVASTWR
ncbi:MAG: DUF4190 domain-containing protein [Planctomycetes bacterium]|nr:DUF4190 domain-containing protein [Planctomycetota bacterium]